MKKILAFAATAAIVLSVGTVSVFARAEKNKPLSASDTCPVTVGGCIAGCDTGSCDTDENGDGVCDNRVQGTYRCDSEKGVCDGSGYADENGDGVCDNRGQRTDRCDTGKETCDGSGNSACGSGRTCAGKGHGKGRHR